MSSGSKVDLQGDSVALQTCLDYRLQANIRLLGLSDPPSDSGIVTLTVMVSLVSGSLALEAIMLIPATKACCALEFDMVASGEATSHSPVALALTTVPRGGTFPKASVTRTT